MLAKKRIPKPGVRKETAKKKATASAKKWIVIASKKRVGAPDLSPHRNEHDR
jgi:hypothetical protein